MKGIANTKTNANEDIFILFNNIYRSTMDQCQLCGWSERMKTRRKTEQQALAISAPPGSYADTNIGFQMA